MSPNFRRALVQRAARLFDLSMVGVSLVAAVGISAGYSSWPSLAEFFLLRVKLVNVLILGVYLVVCAAIFSYCGFYASHRLSRWTRQAREIVLATTVITALLYLLPREMRFATKEFLLLFWVINFALLSLSRLAAYQVFYYARARGKNFRNLVIVGEGQEAVALAHRIEEEPTLGYRVLRIIDTKNKDEVKAKAS